jgi:hypothetical protein
MNRLWTWLFLSASIMVLLQQSVPARSQDVSVMLAAVSRDNSMLTGGISSGKLTAKGMVFVEPLALLALSGEWRSLPCDPHHQDSCPKFEEEYLSKPHTYTVVSADGHGTTINAAPVKLSECYDYTGTGTYSGADIARSAIAAGSTDLFGDSPPLQLLGTAEARPILKALTAFVPGRLDSNLYLRLFSVQLEDRDLVLVQRASADYAGKPEESSLKHIFAIGTMEQSRFHLLHWKRNTEDEDERVLGTVRLKSGRDFLITSVSDPESQWFRVYGIRDGKLIVVYTGGGSSC